MAHYSTADNRDQVLNFYRNALSEYGGVIECAGDKPVGLPVRTGEGLTCDHSDHSDHSEHSEHSDFDHGFPHSQSHPGDLELKAGSPRHQHMWSCKVEHLGHPLQPDRARSSPRLRQPTAGDQLRGAKIPRTRNQCALLALR